MKPFAAHLAAARGSLIKARREYIRERRWRAEDWYRAWPVLGDEVEQAVREARK